jgi:N-acetyltransferase
MNVQPVTLEGITIRLEPLSIDHLKEMAEAGADSSIWEFMPSPGSSIETMRAFIEAALADQHAGTALPFATIHVPTGRIIGSTRFGNISVEHRRVEIGWTWIAPEFQRTGVNTEAKYLMMRHAFEALGCNRVEFKTNALNLRSRTAILRIGAREEGTFRCHMVNADGTLRDTIYFSVTRVEWPAVKARLEQLMRRESFK